MFETEEEFLKAAREQYLHGDTQLALDTMEVYGFDENDLNLSERPHGL